MSKFRATGSALGRLSGATLTVAAGLTCGGCGDYEDVGVAQLALTNIGNATEFRNKLAQDPYGSYLLTADIDLGNTTLHIDKFHGQLDGGGRSIKNVRQVLDLTTGNAGIFRQLQGATIKNLNLTGLNMQALAAGGLATQCTTTVIQNVTVAGTVKGAGSTGALCGAMAGGSISNSSASGSVTSTAGSAGGLVGATGIDRGGRSITVSSSAVASMTVTGKTSTGGLVGHCQDPTISRSTVDATVSTAGSAGGICGTMNGGSIGSSYAKGTVTSTGQYAGGLIGSGGVGQLATGGPQVRISYAQTTVSASSYAGGILGYGVNSRIEDVYVVGNVTGRTYVGGIVGYEDATATGGWILDKAIYRGSVTDTSRANWAGVLGGYRDNVTRWEATYFDSSLDGMPQNYLVRSTSQRPATSTALKTPTTADGGVYCGNTPPATRCGDNTFSEQEWTAGSTDQHHALLNMPGPNAQPR